MLIIQEHQNNIFDQVFFFHPQSTHILEQILPVYFVFLDITVSNTCARLYSTRATRVDDCIDE